MDAFSPDQVHTADGEIWIPRGEAAAGITSSLRLIVFGVTGCNY